MITKNKHAKWVKRHHKFEFHCDVTRLTGVRDRIALPSDRPSFSGQLPLGRRLVQLVQELPLGPDSSLYSPPTPQICLVCEWRDSPGLSACHGR